MISKLKISLFSTILCWCCLGINLPINTEDSVNEVTLKQKEMLNTTVIVRTRSGSGSGIIIGCSNSNTVNLFKYHVLTSAHVIYSKFAEFLREVDSITGKVKIEVVDTGCEICIFDYQKQNWNNYNAKLVVENIGYDLAILSFVSKQELAVVKIANGDMLKQVRVFDEIFVVGCPFGFTPMPTTGIVSEILTETNNGQERIIYGSTAQIVPGSSGGGLFKKYAGKYYLIGIPYKVVTTQSGQMISHLSYAISMITAGDFIDQSLVTNPCTK